VINAASSVAPVVAQISQVAPNPQATNISSNNLPTSHYQQNQQPQLQQPHIQSQASLITPLNITIPSPSIINPLTSGLQNNPSPTGTNNNNNNNQFNNLFNTHQSGGVNQAVDNI
jgi:hypothetical protein